MRRIKNKGQVKDESLYMKKKLAFIILQYNTPEETIECVKSIQKMLPEQKEYSIVIVDNSSTKKNLKKFYELFKNIKNIDILKLDKNYGFSRGNNLGFKYAREKYNPEFYYIINNDAITCQKDVLKIIGREYKKNGFDIMGPDISSPERKHVNPIKSIGNYRELYLFKLRLELKKILLGLNLRRKFKNFYNKNGKEENNVRDISSGKYCLHGSGLIFSKKAFNKIEKPFFPETFLYLEEEILLYNSRKFNLKMFYCPRLKLIHKKGKTFDKNKLKEIDKIKNRIKSIKIFLKYMKNNSKRKIQK